MADQQYSFLEFFDDKIKILSSATVFASIVLSFIPQESDLYINYGHIINLIGIFLIILIIAILYIAITKLSTPINLLKSKKDVPALIIDILLFLMFIILLIGFITFILLQLANKFNTGTFPLLFCILLDITIGIWTIFGYINEKRNDTGNKKDNLNDIIIVCIISFIILSILTCLIMLFSIIIDNNIILSYKQWAYLMLVTLLCCSILGIYRAIKDIKIANIYLKINEIVTRLLANKSTIGVVCLILGIFILGIVVANYVIPAPPSIIGSWQDIQGNKLKFTNNVIYISNGSNNNLIGSWVKINNTHYEITRASGFIISNDIIYYENESNSYTIILENASTFYFENNKNLSYIKIH